MTTICLASTQSEENGSESAQRHFGMQYRTAINQVKRTQEEKVMLSEEVVRLVNRLEELMGFASQKVDMYNRKVEQCAEGAQQGAETVLDRGAVAALRKDCKLASGRAAFFNSEVERLQCIYKESIKELGPYAAGPLPTSS